MTIANMDEDDNLDDFEPIHGKSNPLISKIPGGGITVLILVLTSSASFGLGMLAERGLLGQGSGLTISSQNSVGGDSKGIHTLTTGGQVVGSKDTKKYYLPWCAQATTISPASMVWFDSQESAKAKGYTPDAGCAGL